ncbi:MAG: hypothetical protein V4440_04700 [Pseudomonadota bacterium]
MAYTALNLITDVLLDMGVLADQETPTASQSVGALVKLNDLIESWNLDPQRVYGATERILPMVASQASYTIGVGGDLNITRPNIVTAAYIRNTSYTVPNQQDMPMALLTDQQWANLPNKFVTGTFPYAIWFDNTYPLVTAHVSPVPTVGTYSVIFWDSDIDAILTLNTVLSLPPGYKRALKYALYIELAPSYQIEVPQSIVTLAASSKQSVDRNNLQINELQTSGGSWYDITSNLIRNW